MFLYLLVLFIVMPLVELAVLMEVHERMGLLWTIGLVVFTGVVGASLAKLQGLVVVARIQSDLREGRLPAPRVMDGVMILLAGVLLITPGLITDAVGFLLLVPAVRREIRMWLKRKLGEKLRDGTVNLTFKNE